MRLGFALGLVTWACIEWRAVRYIVAIVAVGVCMVTLVIVPIAIILWLMTEPE